MAAHNENTPAGFHSQYVAPAWRWLRNNHLILITTALFALATISSLVMIDMNFQDEKKTLIINSEASVNRNPELMAQIYLPAFRLLSSEPGEVQVREASLERLKDLSRQLIADDNNLFYRVELEDTRQNEEFSYDERDLAAEDPDYELKTSRFNTFDNSLLSRNFQGIISNYVRGSDGKTKLGRLKVYYTTPPDDDQIELMVIRYRLGILAATGVTLLFYLYLVRYLIMPLRRVVGRIDERARRGARIVTRPSSELERRYNDLARDSLLMELNRAAADLMSRALTGRHELPESVSLLGESGALVARAMQISTLGIYRAEMSQAGAVVNFLAVAPKPAPDPLEAFGYDRDARQTLVEQLVERAGHPEDLDARSLPPEGDGLLFAGWIAHSDEQWRLDLLLARLDPGPRDSVEWMRDTLRRVCRRLGDDVRVIDAQRERIYSEKRRANISLSRQLGHDLTNVIATSKLDLSTARAFLKSKDAESLSGSRRFDLFSSSVERLVANTQFLQEIVDIYRSFTYIKHPRYEPSELNRLLEEIVHIFRLSTSQRFTIETRFDDKIPTANLEVRLIKLAVFNLLNNAVEALKRKPEQSDHELIEIETEFLEKSRRMRVVLRDSGTGIRGDDGELLSEDRIQQVFSLGVSTKTAENAGEGLGLNWVKSIVVEFHHGEIDAHNRPEGGAKFVIEIPGDLPAGELGVPE